MQGAGTNMQGRPLAFKRTLPHPKPSRRTVCVASPPSKYRSRQPSQEQLALAGASDRCEEATVTECLWPEAADVCLPAQLASRIRCPMMESSEASVTTTGSTAA